MVALALSITTRRLLREALGSARAQSSALLGLAGHSMALHRLLLAAAPPRQRLTSVAERDIVASRTAAPDHDGRGAEGDAAVLRARPTRQPEHHGHIPQGVHQGDVHAGPSQGIYVAPPLHISTTQLTYLLTQGLCGVGLV